MMKGLLGIVGLGVAVLGVGCGTHSGIGNVGTGGNGGGGTGGTAGQGGNGSGGTAGEGVIGTGGAAGEAVIGTGGAAGEGVIGTGGTAGEGVFGTGGAAGTGVGGIPDFCAGAAGAPATRPAKTLAFRAPVDYATGSGAFAVAAGDLNGDGKIDLALLDRTAGVRVMINNGDGTFGGPVNHALGSSPVAIALGDLNGDHTIDIAVATGAGISVLRNPGNADFASPVTYVVGNNSLALALGDLDHDGLLDIAVADGGGASGIGDVGILLNTGGATFSAQNYGTTIQPTSIALGDLNGDCIPDVVVSDQGGLTWLPGNGYGGLSAQSHLANGTAGASVVVADLDGDGKMDLVEGDQGLASPGVGYVLLKRGLSFTAPVRYSLLDAPGNSATSNTAGVGVAVGDLNGDGRPDLIGIAPCCNLGVFLNNSDGSFATPVAVSMQPYPVSLAHGDFNGDGLEDIAIVSSNNGGFSFLSNLRVLINGSH
jgi:hypothetical protein